MKKISDSYIQLQILNKIINLRLQNMPCWDSPLPQILRHAFFPGPSRDRTETSEITSIQLVAILPFMASTLRVGVNSIYVAPVFNSQLYANKKEMLRGS